MTREEAIRRLKQGAPFSELYYPDWEEALAMGIDALQAEPFKAFAHWVASEVCNEAFEDMWSLGAFAEVACRKLYALGIVQKFRDEWVYVDKDELDDGENG